MSHGYAGEGDAFFRGWALADVPAGFSFLRWLSDESGTPAIVKRLGEDGACLFGDALRANPEYRRMYVLDARRAYWWIRNARWATSPELLAAAEERVLDACCMLELGGVDPRDIVMMCQCQSHRCVCTDCDVNDGARFC